MKAGMVHRQRTESEPAELDRRSIGDTFVDRIPGAADALLKDEEGYRFLVENMREGLVMVDEKAIITFANERFCEIVGYTREEARNKPLSNALQTLRGTHLRTLKEQMKKRKKGIQEPYEIEWTRKDGKKVYVVVSPKPIFDRKGSFKGAFAIVTDITRLKHTEQTLKQSRDNLERHVEKRTTELKKAEAELGNSEARLRAILSASPLGIGLVENRVMQWHNKAMAEMLGYDPGELSGKDARMLYPSDEEYQRAGTAIASLSEKEGTPVIDTKWVRKDGSIFSCRVRYAHLQDPVSENHQEILAIAEDMTERNQLEAQLQQSQKMEAMGTLAGGVAHDFNNLLTSIIGNADLALMDMSKDDPSYEKFEEIMKAGKRAASLTRQLLAFSRKQVVQPEVLNLNECLGDTEKMLRRLVGEHILFHAIPGENLWDIYADPGQMEQVLMNLAVNARDAMPGGGKLTIETANVELDAGYFRKHGIDNPAGPYVMLAVTDDGVGMDGETRSRIFDPFFTTKGKGKGTGLGLSMVYGIVKQNNGYIWVYSEKGKGTSFKVYLPKAEAESAGPKKNRTVAGSLEGNETILLVEDEGVVRDMAQKFLERYGYNVFRAASPREAMRISLEYQDEIHLLLTDMVMPGMNGKDLAALIKSERPETKVVYMSGYTNSTISHQGVLDKGVEFIEKPFSLAQLARQIRRVLNEVDIRERQEPRNAVLEKASATKHCRDGGSKC